MSKPLLLRTGKVAIAAMRHVVQWSKKGRCPGLIGGGLIRSAGGWPAVKQAYREGIRLASDERLLGSSAFVERTLKGAGEEYDRGCGCEALASSYRSWSAPCANSWESIREN